MKHPITGKETLDRDWASSIYQGGKLYYAADCNHGDNKRLGLVCPLCSEAVFLAKGEILRPCWKHYRVSAETKYCDRRSLTKEGRKELEKLQPKATGQRLKLFNRRFWEIFCHEKFISRNPRQVCEKLNKRIGDRYGNKAKLDLGAIVDHCREQWYVEEILKNLPQSIRAATNPDSNFDQFLENPAVKMFVESDPDLVLDAYLSLTGSSFSVLRHKILSEVIEWLPTSTARESFSKVIYNSVIDCFEVFLPPIHSNQVANMAVTSLILTDWEKAIAALDDKGKAIGFG
jgi:hypothetical protein